MTMFKGSDRLADLQAARQRGKNVSRRKLTVHRSECIKIINFKFTLRVLLAQRSLQTRAGRTGSTRLISVGFTLAGWLNEPDAQ